MNFTEFDKEISEEFGFSKQLSNKIVAFILKRMLKRILFGEEISFWLIGTLKLRIRKPRRFMHLKTGKMMINKKSYYLTFQPTAGMAKKLKEKIVYDGA